MRSLEHVLIIVVAYPMLIVRIGYQLAQEKVIGLPAHPNYVKCILQLLVHLLGRVIAMVSFHHANMIAQTTFVLRKHVLIMVVHTLKQIVRLGQVNVLLIHHIMDVPSKLVLML